MYQYLVIDIFLLFSCNKKKNFSDYAQAIFFTLGSEDFLILFNIFKKNKK